VPRLRPAGETANGKWPFAAVRTMAAIAGNAESANSYFSTGAFLSDHSPKPCSRLEATCAALAAAVVDCGAHIIITITASGAPARMVSKYKPPVSAAAGQVRRALLLAVAPEAWAPERARPLAAHH
jgi:pyruvate kinase